MVSGDGINSLLIKPIAKESNRSLDIELRHQLLSRLRELKDRSQEQDPTGMVRRKRTEWILG